MKCNEGTLGDDQQRDRSFPVTVGRSIVTYTTSLGLARESESRTFCAQTLRCSVTG